MLTVVHTADLHLGKNRKHHDYLNQQRLMLWAITNDLLSIIKTVTPDDILWFIVAGDIFDRNEDTTREELYLFLEWLWDLSERTKRYSNVHTYMIDGNHDRQPDLECPSILTPIARLAPPNITIAAVDPMFLVEKSLLLVPFGGYSSESYQRLIEKFKPTFMVGHECLSNIVTDVGYTPRDQDKYIDISAIENGVVATFMGDIHNSQKCGRAAWYSGSPVTLDHGHKPPKGLLVHRFENETGSWRYTCQPELIPLTNSEIKTHIQVGRVDDEKKLTSVIDSLKENQNNYVQIVVTPETYAAIDKEIPGFFQNPQVSWEFKQEAVTVKNVEDAVETENDEQTYYRPLIRQWVSEALINLTEDERSECLTRLFDVFDKRLAVACHNKESVA